LSSGRSRSSGGRNVSWATTTENDSISAGNGDRNARRSRASDARGASLRGDSGDEDNQQQQRREERQHLTSDKNSWGWLEEEVGTKRWKR
jgi:hypothetical protein